jgi:signal transduction histidine kinase
MARHYGGPVKSAVNASERQARQIEAEDATLSSPLLAGISHELRTPLNAIIGFAEIVYDERMAPLDPVNKEFIQEILNSARHLLHVVNDVLDLSAIQTGHMQFHPEALDVGAIAQEVIENLRPLSEVKGITIDRHIDAVLGTVETDPLRFRQILYNYLSNAIKFTPRGGRIALHARPE